MSYTTRVEESNHSYEWVTLVCAVIRSPRILKAWGSCLWISRVTRMNELWHAYRWVMSLVWTNHVGICSNKELNDTQGMRCLRMNKSCRAYWWVMSRVLLSQVTCVHESCHTTEWVTSHMNKSRHMYEWVMSHVCMSHVTCMDEWRHACRWVMSHALMSQAISVHGSRHTFRIDGACGTYMWLVFMRYDACVHLPCHMHEWV